MRNDPYQIIFLAFIIIILLLVIKRLRLKKLKIYYSPLLGKIEVFEKYNKEKALTINNYVQGVSINDNSIWNSYWGFISQQVLDFCQNKKNPQVLMLGLGAGTISNLIAQKNPAIHQTIIEIDHQIIKACRDYFGLKQLPNSRLIQADVYQLVDQKKAFKIQFDIIIVDVFTGQAPFVSIKSNKPFFIEQLLPYLKKDGSIVFNRPGINKEILENNLKLKEYLATVLKQSQIHLIRDPRGYKNNIVIGTFKKKG